MSMYIEGLIERSYIIIIEKWEWILIHKLTVSHAHTSMYTYIFANFYLTTKKYFQTQTHAHELGLTQTTLWHIGIREMRHTAGGLTHLAARAKFIFFSQFPLYIVYGTIYI